MAKRKIPSDSPQATGKRARLSPNQTAEKPGYHTSGRMDTTFGQRSFFPGLDEASNIAPDSLEYDALEYLQSVR